MENGVKVDFVEGGEEKANLIGGKARHGGQGMNESHHTNNTGMKVEMEDKRRERVRFE